MTLIIQIKSLIFSFIFGMLFALFLNLNHKLVYDVKFVVRLIFTFLYVICMSLLFFIILKRINNAIIHPYLFIAIIIGFIIADVLYDNIVKLIKKWYTYLYKVGDSMARKKSIKKKAKRRLMLFGTLSCFLLGYLAYTATTSVYKIIVLSNKKQQLETNLVQLKKEEEDLNIEITKLKDPDYLARYARENYLYSKNGEYIIKIEDKKKKNSIKKINFFETYKYPIIASLVIVLFSFIWLLKKLNEW